MKQLLLLCLYLFLPAPILAQQLQVTGRVLDAKTKNPMPGVTVLQRGTTNGTSSNSDGTFTLASLPEPDDSVSLVVSSIGYISQQRRVAIGSQPVFQLVTDTLIIECYVGLPKLDVGLASAVRYTPVGGVVRLYGYRWLPRPYMVPVAATFSYHTNLRRNHDFTASLVLPSLGKLGPLYVGELLSYQQVRNAPANLSFRSYNAVFNVDLSRFNTAYLPTVLLGGGYARFQEASGTETRPGVQGYGYTLGLQQQVLPNSLGIHASAQATRWPGGWQWQGQLMHYLPANLQTSLTFHHLPRYSDLVLTLTKSFY